MIIYCSGMAHHNSESGKFNHYPAIQSRLLLPASPLSSKSEEGFLLTRVFTVVKKGKDPCFGLFFCIKFG